jgi:hypothetical protein
MDHSEVLGCMMTVSDRNHDTRLNYAELAYTLEHYTASFERLQSGLYAEQLIRHCDYNHNGYIELEELQHRPFCMSATQHEAWVRFVCNRAQHSNAAYVDYVEHTQRVLSLGAANSNTTVKALLKSAQELMQKDVANTQSAQEAPEKELKNVREGAKDWQVVLAILMLCPLLCCICIVI